MTRDPSLDGRGGTMFAEIPWDTSCPIQTHQQLQRQQAVVRWAVPRSVQDDRGHQGCRSWVLGVPMIRSYWTTRCSIQSTMVFLPTARELSSQVQVPGAGDVSRNRYQGGPRCGKFP